MQDFTKNERVAADAQGWTLIEIYDARGYHSYAVAPTASSPLASPYDAFQFVWQRARTGDNLCRRALGLIAASELAGKSSTKRRRK
jgi:hypothetical protein